MKMVIVMMVNGAKTIQMAKVNMCLHKINDHITVNGLMVYKMVKEQNNIRTVQAMLENSHKVSNTVKAVCNIQMELLMRDNSSKTRLMGREYH